MNCGSQAKCNLAMYFYFKGFSIQSRFEVRILFLQKSECNEASTRALMHDACKMQKKHRKIFCVYVFDFPSIGSKWVLDEICKRPKLESDKKSALSLQRKPISTLFTHYWLMKRKTERTFSILLPHHHWKVSNETHFKWKNWRGNRRFCSTFISTHLKFVYFAFHFIHFCPVKTDVRLFCTKIDICIRD